MSTSQAPKRNGKDKECHLLRLPPEIRIMIAELVLGNLNVVPQCGTSRGLRIRTSPCEAEFEDDPTTWCGNVTWYLYGNWRRVSRPDYGGPPKAFGISLGLLRTCKTLYNEARDIVFAKNNFVFMNMRDLYRFREKLTQDQDRQIRELTIVHELWIQGYQARLTPWGASTTNCIFPFPNLEKVHLVAYIGIQDLYSFCQGREHLCQVDLSFLKTNVNRRMFKNSQDNTPGPEFIVTIDSDSSLLSWARERYPDGDDDVLRLMLGMTEGKKQRCIERLKKTIEA